VSAKVWGSGASNIWMSACMEAKCLRGQTTCPLHYMNLQRHYQSPDKSHYPADQTVYGIKPVCLHKIKHKSIISQKWYANKEHTDLMNRQD